MYKVVSKLCERCGKKFHTRKPAQKYCSRECANQARAGINHHNYAEKIELVCKRCGKKYSVIPYRKNVSRFCSIECKNSVEMEIGTIYRCRWCRKMFMASKHAEFCSNRCKREAGKALLEHDYEKYYPNHGPDELEKVCSICGKTFVGQLEFCDAICNENSYFINKALYDTNYIKIKYYLEQRAITREEQ